MPLAFSSKICKSRVLKGEHKANMGAAILQLRAEIEARFESPLEIRKRPEKGLIPTGIAAMDELTSGGIPRGTLSEICGPESSGRTTLAFAILGQATQRGECCAWIDAAGVFDPASAMEVGVDLGRVLWVNCGGNAEHALKAVDLLIQAGGFGLVVLDLGDTPDKEARRIPMASWFRLRHAAERTGAALVAVERQVNARSCSALQIEMRRAKQGAVWAGKLLRGLAVQAESRKHYRARTAEFRAAR
jgi:recombination protein RecA